MEAKAGGWTILLVDDEPDILTSLQRFLGAAMPGVRLIARDGGVSGLRALETERVDLILTDYKMPRMNGLEFLAHANKLAPRVPKVMVTAFPDLDVAIQAINDGHVQQFLTKPVDPMKLVEIIHQILTNRDEYVARQVAFAHAIIEATKHPARPA